MHFLKILLLPFVRDVHQSKSNRKGRMFGSLFIIGTIFFTISCSSQESRENFDTLLCWLRPSCLPSQSSSTRSYPPRQTQVSSSSPILPTHSPPPCRTTLKTTVTAKNPSITISYIEPTTQADGAQLTNLAMTTIYQDIGNGFVKTKDVPATSPEGGGKIIETLSIPVDPEEEKETTICVTSTNSVGQEG